MHSEKELIAGCKKGDRKFQRELYDRFSGSMYVVCLRYARGTQEAEDILQDSFIKVFAQLGSFRGDSSLGYWIKRIVINTALNSIRNKLYLFPMVDVQDLNQPSPEPELSGMQLQDLLQMIQELPEGCRVVFNLYAIEGYKHKEIAEMLGISEGTSKSQYARARQILGSELIKNNQIRYERYS